MLRETLVNEILSEPNVQACLKGFETASGKDKKAFERFYAVANDIREMEFISISGKVFFQSPLKLSHSAGKKLLLKVVDSHVAVHCSGYWGIEKVHFSPFNSNNQPNIAFRSNPKAKKFNGDQTEFPASGFVADELLPYPKKHEREINLKDHAANSASESWIVETDKKFVEQHLLADDVYELNLQTKTGEVSKYPSKDFQYQLQQFFIRE